MATKKASPFEKMMEKKFPKGAAITPTKKGKKVVDSDMDKMKKGGKVKGKC